MPKLVIWGASSQAIVIADIVRAEGRYEIAGFLDDVDPGRAGEAFCGATVLGGADELPALRDAGVTHGILGFYGSHEARAHTAQRFLDAGFELATAIHPSAIVSDAARIGPGSSVHLGVIVEPEVEVGANVILNSGSAVGHHAKIRDGVHVGGRSTVGGLTDIGEGALIELGAVVVRAITIGAGTRVGSMSLVVKDLPAGVLAYGIPAKVIRELS
jgi:UDP-N-acetylbacillosamine N-acetyltransferase